MVFKVSLIIFLVSIGVWLLWNLPYVELIAAISAFVAAIASAVER